MSTERVEGQMIEGGSVRRLVLRSIFLSGTGDVAGAVESAEDNGPRITVYAFRVQGKAVCGANGDDWEGKYYPFSIIHVCIRGLGTA